MDNETRLQVADNIPVIVPNQELDVRFLTLTYKQIIALENEIEQDSKNLQSFQYG